MSYRTLRFGDRTISYDAGLNSLPSSMSMGSQNNDNSNEENSDQDSTISSDETPRKIPISPDPQNDDGIGSSDDEASAHSSNASTNSSSCCSSLMMMHQNSMESEKTSSLFESDSSPNLSQANNRKKVIRPDPSAINQLLAFDEEEEDDYEDEDQNFDSDEETKARKTGWQKTIVKDLANLAPSQGIQRRHSISICESKKSLSRKTSLGSITSSNSSGTSTATSSAMSSTSNSPKHSRVEDPSKVFTGYRLDVGQMHASLQDELENANQPWMKNNDNTNDSMKTLSLNLQEIAHIRSVLTKAELEGLPIDGNVRSNVENGRVCFLCMKTRFGLFNRGHNCEMCKQVVCYRCHSKMRIPTEHFNNTPVFALSPTQSNNQVRSSLGSSSSSYEFPHLMSQVEKTPTPSHSKNTNKKKKLSLPGTLGLLGAANSVGSAPNSPNTDRKNHIETSGVNDKTLPTISGHVSLPPATLNKKYNTLPTKSRRMSWISSRDSEREKLEGSLLTICTDCKDMVLQIIRASRTTKRIHMVKSMFSTLSHDSNSR